MSSLIQKFAIHFCLDFNSRPACSDKGWTWSPFVFKFSNKTAEPAGGLNAGINTTVYTAVGIESGGNFVGVGVTLLNFIGAGNTFLNRGNGVVDISVDSGAASDAVVKENFTVTSNTQTVFTLHRLGKQDYLMFMLMVLS